VTKRSRQREYSASHKTNLRENVRSKNAAHQQGPCNNVQTMTKHTTGEEVSAKGGDQVHEKRPHMKLTRASKRRGTKHSTQDKGTKQTRSTMLKNWILIADKEQHKMRIHTAPLTTEADEGGKQLNTESHNGCFKKSTALKQVSNTRN